MRESTLDQNVETKKLIKFLWENRDKILLKFKNILKLLYQRLIVLLESLDLCQIKAEAKIKARFF